MNTLVRSFTRTLTSAAATTTTATTATTLSVRALSSLSSASITNSSHRSTLQTNNKIYNHSTLNQVLRVTMRSFASDASNNSSASSSSSSPSSITTTPKKVKETTGLTGVPVVANSRQVLTSLYEQTFEELKVLPSDLFYRKTVQEFSQYRLSVVQQNEDIGLIEDIIGAGQIEELIQAAEDEIDLIRYLADEQPWVGVDPNKQPEILIHVPEEIRATLDSVSDEGHEYHPELLRLFPDLATRGRKATRQASAVNPAATNAAGATVAASSGTTGQEKAKPTSASTIPTPPPPTPTKK